MWKPALFACLAVLVLDMGCAKKTKLSEEEQAVAAFKQVVENYMQTYKQGKHEQVYHIDEVHHTDPYTRIPVIDVQGGWRKSYSEISGDPGIDVRKTDSLVSPYLGTLEFHTNLYVSRSAYDSEDSASQTTDFPTTPSDVRRHLHTYAYQNGAWVLQSRKQFVYEDWQDCPEGE
jgi:hypothetical protein